MGLGLRLPLTGAQIVVDIGGSGVRIAALTPDGRAAGVRRSDCSSMEDLIATVRAVEHRPGWLGLSVAGQVQIATGEVLSSRAAPWLAGDPGGELSQAFCCPVAVVNDGIAHALALKTIPGLRLGAICLVPGSGLAFGVLSEQGEPMAALSGINWEIGDLELATRASQPWAWWALGENGLDELVNSLGKEDGHRHFGHRLGVLARRLAIVFQPRTIGFSGGYVSRYWRWLEPGVRQELDGLLIAGDAPAVVAHSQTEPALTGLAQLLPRQPR